MKFQLEAKVSFSLTFLVALILNAPKILSLQPDTVLSQWVQFNLPEFFLQCSLSWFLAMICYFFFQKVTVYQFEKQKKYLTLLSFLIFFAGITYLAILIHSKLFEIGMPFNFFRMTYFLKSALIFLFFGLMVYIWEKNEEAREKKEENQRLQNLYLNAQLQALRQQINPHFLFNALSSLSAIVRENPPLAQKYIGHLSKVFRYGLVDSETLVTVSTELEELKSYFELIQMRFETGVTLEIDIPDSIRKYSLPHLSIQPLVENAIKHNQFSSTNPLKIRIFTEENNLIVCNNFSPLKIKEPSTQIGLSNLEERFKILTGQSILIQQSEESFLVKLPLIYENAPFGG
ncbi:sensor histidine kinase [Algoriphagus zhangzhouensis]|uniref:Histidine kinase n=1 Tax=Algoriphagus zhangzhouensis TaxID=1073327 RepID=A0A1M7Z4Y4_9BACT|nr:histidine kinase [Algoriphagus zhangzhouensis]TDY48754.1 histidine kinase [Algoriphagus zhangzhouensis]SHO59904.1 Histidine kinase [Algoriphagus zhangzhouensis]